MDLVIVGPGRAGGSIALAAGAAGHRVTGVLSRSPTSFGPTLEWDEPLPACDLVVMSVSDAAIAPVAERLAPFLASVGAVIHLSGFTSVAALGPVAERHIPTGSVHPLQTLPDPQRGAAALEGAWAAVTAASDLAPILESFADSLGMRPFRLEDAAKPLYHAAAAAAANYVVQALAVAGDLLGAAEVPVAAVEPLARRVLDNVFEMGADEALTGPIARGDRATVAGQQAAADRVSETVGRQFQLLAEATAERVRGRL